MLSVCCPLAGAEGHKKIFDRSAGQVFSTSAFLRLSMSGRNLFLKSMKIFIFSGPATFIKDIKIPVESKQGAENSRVKDLFTHDLPMDAGKGVSHCASGGASGWECSAPLSVVRLEEDDPDHGGTIAHEIGHHLGLGDTYAGGMFSAQREPAEPAMFADFANGCGVEVGAFDLLLGTVSAAPRPNDPRLRRDFMGNANRTKKWVDRRTWDYLYTRFNGTREKRVLPAKQQGWLTVIGLVGADGSGESRRCGSATFLWPMPLQPPVRLVRGPGGLGRRPARAAVFLPRFRGGSPRHHHTRQSAHLPTVHQRDRPVQLKHGGSVVDVVDVTPNPPSVTVVSPNGGEQLSGVTTVTWSASDPDGGQLISAVLYASDETGFTPIATDLEGTSFSWDTSLSPATNAGRIIVVVSDGVNEAFDESDGTFSVVDGPPAVAITSPADGSTLPAGQTVLFQGSAYDANDGELTGDALLFTSSRDGELGRGSTLQVSGLTVGSHTITLSATDSGNNTATASITVEVGANQSAWA